jgi:hypothetical protein
MQRLCVGESNSHIKTTGGRWKESEKARVVVILSYLFVQCCRTVEWFFEGCELFMNYLCDALEMTYPECIIPHHKYCIIHLGTMDVTPNRSMAVESSS